MKRQIKLLCVLSLFFSALCLTSCSERVDAGSEGILVIISTAPTKALMM